MRGFLKFFTGFSLVLMVATFSFAQTNIGFKAIGGKVGFVDPEEGIESTFGIGATADLGTISRDIHLGAFIEYWGKSYTAGGFETSFSETSLGAVGKYYIQMEGSKFQPYAGGGMSLTFGKSKVTIPSIAGFPGGEESSTNTEIGFRVFVGADYELSSDWRGFGEILYHTDGAEYLAIFVGVVKILGD